MALLVACSVGGISSCVNGPILPEQNVSEEQIEFIEGLPDHISDALIQYEEDVAAFESIALIINASNTVLNRYELSSFPIRVCFFGGNNELNSRIAEAASDWENFDNSIKFDFGDLAEPQQCTNANGSFFHIRISFNYSGYWSLLGKQSWLVVGQSQSSMNFGGWDIWATTPSLEYIKPFVLHEFGHALSFEHEHKHPFAYCEEEYDWNEIYDYLESPPHNWSREKVDYNMRRVLHTSVVAPNDFDPSSKMAYSFPEQFFKDGKASSCYVPSNNFELSSLDRAGAKHAYPTGFGSSAQYEANLRTDEAVVNQFLEGQAVNAPNVSILRQRYRVAYPAPRIAIQRNVIRTPTRTRNTNP